GRAVGLPGVERPGVLRVSVVEDLELAHPLVGGVSPAGVSDRQAVVAPRRQLELDSGREVRELLVEVDRASLVRLALQDTVSHLIVLDRPGPVGEVLAVEDRLESWGAVLG